MRRDSREQTSGGAVEKRTAEGAMRTTIEMMDTHRPHRVA
jgi:hypothetical protein